MTPIEVIAFVVAGFCPSPALTPGKTNALLTKEVICSPDFRTGVYRHVPESEKRQAAKRYGLDYERTRKEVEYDHLIPLELGGSNDLANIWPEYYRPHPGAHEKDLIENYLHRQVCEGKMTLEAAQEEIAGNWYAVYKKVFVDKK